MRQFLVVTSTLLVTAIRRGLYTTLLVSVLAPVLLLVVLFSIPSTSSLELSYLDMSRHVLVITSSSSSGNCHSARLVKGFVTANTSTLSTHVLLVRVELSELEISGKRYNYTSGVVLPREVFTSLGKPSVVEITVNSTTREYPVAGSWSSNIVLLADSELEFNPEIYVCTSSQSSILVGLLERLEGDLLRTTGFWILLLSLVYLPIIYTAQRRVVEALHVNFRVLTASGVDSLTLYFSTLTALVALYLVVVLYVCALGVVLVYTAWSLLSYFILIPPPTLRTSVLTLLLVEILLGVLVTPLASRGVSKCY